MIIRVANRTLKSKQKLKFALSPVKGIGKSNVNILLKLTYEEAVKSADLKKELGTYEEFILKDLGDLPESVIVIIRNMIDANFTVEDDLRREKKANIDRLVDLGTWRGIRHKSGLAVRGQRTRKNTRTRRKGNR
jgi:small subunit ribosomal protein S13